MTIKYLCDICGRSYNTKLDALACENSHPSISCDCGIAWCYCEKDVLIKGGVAFICCMSCNRVALVEGLA